MFGTRYEEYAVFEDNLPFKFETDITVTSTVYNSQTNWHENLELQFCTEGHGCVLMDKENYKIEKYKIAVANSNVIHHTSTTEKMKYDCLIIDTAFCVQMGINTSVLYFEPCFKSEKIWGIYEEFLRVYKNTDDICRSARLNALTIEILIELRVNHMLEEKTRDTKKSHFEVIKKAIKYIRENYDKKLLLDEIAQNVYMDKYTLSREFKKTTNQTVVQYINSYRCTKASEYISEGMAVSQAALMCGFTNMSFFTKTFKRYMGSQPHTYKK